MTNKKRIQTTSNDEKLRYTTMFSLIAIASVLLVSNPSLAHASLIGDEVTVELLGSGPVNPQTATILEADGPEFSWGDYANCGVPDEQIDVDIEESTITITLFESEGLFSVCLDPLTFIITDLDWGNTFGIVTGITISEDPFSDSTAQVLDKDSVEITIDADGAIFTGELEFVFELETNHGTCSENQEICKVATIVEEETEDGIIVVGEDIIWNFQIFAVNTSSETWVDVKVKDRFGGDLAVGDSPVTEFLTPELQVDAMSLTNLDCELTQKGKTQKEFLDCIVDSSETEDDIVPEGDELFSPGETATVSVLAETDFNHGQGKKDPTGKREYTSCGVHEINSGATLTGVTEFGESVSVSTSSITVGVFDFADLSGDCDEDGFTDGEELNTYGTDPFDPNDIPTCNGINTIDICIDGDGIATAQSGSFSALWGMSLQTWPTGGGNEGIDWFDVDDNDTWTAGGLMDAIHLEDNNGACGTGIRNGQYDLGSDCVVLDLGNILVNGLGVNCDLEVGAFCNGSETAYLGNNGMKFLEGEILLDGFYNNGEDIIIDVNGDGIFN